MKMMKKIAAVFTLAFAAVAASSARAATGDIYEIVPLGLAGTADAGKPLYGTDWKGLTPETALDAGQSFEFIVRLVSRSAVLPSPTNSWDIYYAGHGSAEYAAAMYPLQIALLVSGRPVGAEVYDIKSNAGLNGSKAFTDLYCRYTVKPGDIALPAVFPKNEATEGATFMLINDDKWQVRDEYANQAVFAYCSDEVKTLAVSKRPVGQFASICQTYTLADLNFHVKTIDFDSKEDVAGMWWRVVNEGATTTTNVPMVDLTGSVSVTNAVELFVWAEDKSAVVMKPADGGRIERMTIKTSPVAATAEEVDVFRFWTVPGKTSYPISFEGQAEGKSTRLYLSATTNFTYDASGTLQTNFLTRPVYCTGPLPPSVKVTLADNVSAGTAVAALSGNLEDMGQDKALALRVRLTRPLASGTANLTLKVSLADDPSADVFAGNYISLSQSPVASYEVRSETNITFTAGGASEQMIYIWPLGGDLRTTDGGILIEPVFAGGTTADVSAYDTANGGFRLKIADIPPQIVAPAAGGTLSVSSATAFTVPVQIVDSYRDLHAPQTYKVELRGETTGSYFVTNGVAFRLGTSTSVTTGEDELFMKENATVTVSDAQGNISESKFALVVPEEKWVKASFAEGATLPEGSQNLTLTYTLSTPSGRDLYAFLRPLNEAASNTVETAAYESGIQIAQGAVSNTAVRTFNLLDGAAGAGVELKFGIVLRTGDSTNDMVVATYEERPLAIRVVNVAPTVAAATVDERPIANGALRSAPVPMGVNIPLELELADVSAIDFASTNIGERLRVAWKQTDVDASVTDLQGEVDYGFPSDNGWVQGEAEVTTNALGGLKLVFKDSLFFSYEYTTQMVSIAVQDKDMRARAEWGPRFSFRVPVTDQPRVLITRTESDGSVTDMVKNNVSFIEEDFRSGRSAKFTVALSEKPAGASDSSPVTVALSIVRDGDGAIALDTTNVTFTVRKNTADVSFTLLDGGELSDFQLVAEVVGENKNRAGVKWSDYFAKNTAYFTVVNLDPVIKSLGGGVKPDSASTNNVPLGMPVDVKVTVSDIQADLVRGSLGNDERKAFRVEWIGPGGLGGRVTNITYGTTSTGLTNSLTAAFVYAPSQEGFSEVEINIYDGDGGYATTKVLFFIEPTKRIRVLPIGPANRMSSQSKYASQPGLGKGRVWAKASRYDIDAFTHTYYSEVREPQLTLYAFGYPAAATAEGYVDDGNLANAYGETGKDYKLSQSGSSLAQALAAGYYRYGVTGASIADEWRYDNFFYCWFEAAASGEKAEPAISESMNGVMRPATRANAGVSIDALYDAYESEKASYGVKRVEAIFSRELYPEDNMGDINGDGIPDLYVLKYGLGVYDVETGTMSGNDLQNLATYNEDGDALPSTETSLYAAFIPGLRESWLDSEGNSALGRVFNALTEIRGFHPGLNNAPALAGIADVTCESTTNSFSEVELDAARIAGALLPDGNPDITKWSPERPTDPTLEDTDGDGLPDGYEYYIWYQAHVGYMENGVHKFMTGRRYVPTNPGEPEMISSELIAATYDPLVAHPGFARQTTDTDNDGLPDYLEFELGTNPFDFDTDGDGLPDGYEVSMTPAGLSGSATGALADLVLDPLLWATDGVMCDALKNTDNDNQNDALALTKRGDAMASAEVDMNLACVAGTDGSVEWYCSSERFEPVESGAVTAAVFTATVDGKNGTYATTVSLDAGQQYLGRALDKRVAWKVSGSDGAYVLSEPVELERGTPIAVVTNDAPCATMTFAEVPKMFYRAWKYGIDNGFARGAERVHSVANPLEGRIVYSVSSAKVQLIHFQVYQEFGFDPRTGWKRTAVQDEGATSSKNTRNYTHYDEFLSMAFFYYEGTVTADELQPTVQRPLPMIWKAYSTNPMCADSDADGMPDGWELYLMSGPKKYDDSGDRVIDYGPRKTYSPLYDFANVVGKLPPENWDLRDWDDDGLEWPAEYSGVDTAAEYAETTSTIECLEPKWRNKKLPTNPWAEDTDGDGIVDGDEFKLPQVTSVSDNETNARNPFVYGTTGTAGGGLNPLSWDTDQDGLPDPWEVEFHGTYIPGATATTNEVEKILGSVADRSWAAAGIVWARDGMDGTVYDALEDYDGDGLANWQEYMVGAMRCWRYDDTISTWGRHEFDLTAAQSDWDNYWYKTLVDEQGDSYNPHLVSGMFDIGTYFSCNTNVWEEGSYPYGRYYMFRDGVYHNLKHPPTKYIGPFGEMYNAWTFKAVNGQWEGDGAPFVTERNYYLAGDRPPSTAVYPKSYICCDPRNHDTDCDGMDDHYEVFHGFNPLLGASGVDKSHDNQPYDVIYNAYGGDDEALTEGTVYWSAENNYWLNTNTIHRAGVRLKDDGKLSTDDFVAFPWLAGRANADPDGDNIRNQQEAIMPNVQAASTYLHTDPTPLWMTDTSYAGSFTRLYYRGGKTSLTDAIAGNGGVFRGPDGTVYKFADFPGFTYVPLADALLHNYKLENHYDVANWLFNFEENEGYDSDHDFLSDFEEGQAKMAPASDPQQAESPYRRQAMWFNGTDAFLQTALPVSELPCTSYLASEPHQSFLYYTVECWVKPDDAALAKSGVQTVIERAVWTESSNAGDEKFLRKNFQIGLRDGFWFTCFDTAGTDAAQSVDLVSASPAEAGWTHLAATYDGKVLCLYVNGQMMSKATSLKPENGTAAVRVDGAGVIDRGTVFYDTVSVLVGASARTKKGIIFDNSYRGGSETTLDDYANFFNGYIDEVRIWDGARTGSDIKDDMSKRVRYTAALAKENRDKVFAEWLAGARRSPEAPAQLSPELKYHWSFDHLPSAINADDTIDVPAGFGTSGYMVDAKAYWSRPVGWTNAWWHSVGVRSSVYTDTSWVPWIADTVAHLPRLDKTTVDSVYWSADFAGYQSVTNFGFDSFSFTRSGEVFSKWQQMYYKDYTLNIIGGAQPMSYNIYMPLTRYNALSAMNDPRLIELYRFTMRDRDREGFDLLPMGGAYPKRISSAEGGMWDDATASDAWAQTGNDADNDGLPDWWEELAIDNYCLDNPTTGEFTRDSIVTYRGVKMPAWQAYLRDMASGTVVNGGELVQDAEEYRDLRDNDRDGLPDWWEALFGFDTVSVNDANADPDGDGLSNYQEYLIGEVYARLGALSGNVEQFPILNPTLAQSTPGQAVPDYFLRHGSLYLGEMFADHDMIEDDWEDGQSEVSIGGTRIANVSRFVYDADKDPDEQGISNWSRARAVLSGRSLERVLVGSVTNSAEHIFTLSKDEFSAKYEELRATYGSNNVEYVGTLVSSSNANAPNDHCFKVTTVEDKYEQRFIRPVLEIDAAVTYNGDQAFGKGCTLVVQAWNEAKGLMRAPDAVWTFPVDETRLTHYQPIQLRKPLKGFLREGKTTFVVYCAAAVETSEKDSSQNAAAQAVPAFVPGRPYGVMCGIRVGYLSGESFSVELTDVSPSMLRVDLAQAMAIQSAYVDASVKTMTPADWENVLSVGDNEVKTAYMAALNAFQDSLASCVDRAALPADSADLWRLDYVGTNFTLGASNSLPVRVVQGTINGATRGYNNATYYNVLLDTKLPLNERSVLTEADILAKGELDLGWNTLVPAYLAGGAANRAALTNATFSVVFGKPVYSGNVEVHENVLGVAIRNHYEYGRYQTPVHGKSLLTHAGQPTFAWSHTNTIGKAYPAFRLRVWADKEMTSLVYDSGAQRAPRRDAEGRYSWTAPLWTGMMMPTGVEFKANTPYWWSVSMLDAKFTDPARDEIADAFMLQAATPGGGANDYGLLPVAVKYMGPGKFATVADKGLIRVEAYTTIDFGGKPVSVGYVSDSSVLATADGVSCNAILQGLECDGRKYYVRAFIDSDGDGERSAWESWGYASYVETDPVSRQNLGVATYTARAVEPCNVLPGEGQTPECVIYIEDADTNANMLPDVWEWDMDGVLGGPSADLTGSLSPYIFDRDDSVEKTTGIYRELAEQNASPLLYSTMMLRAAAAAQPVNSPAAALVLGGISVTDIETIPEVSISAFSLQDSLISLDLAADGTVGGSAASDVPATIGVRLTLTLQYATALDAAWNDAGTGTAVVTLGAAKKTVTSDELKDASGKALTQVLAEKVAENPSGCYFRVKVKVGAN